MAKPTLIGMTAPNLPEKDSGGGSLSGVQINQSVTTITVGRLGPKRWLHVLVQQSFVQRQRYELHARKERCDAVPADNVTADGLIFIDKTPSAGMELGFSGCYITNPVVFTEPVSGLYRSSRIKRTIRSSGFEINRWGQRSASLVFCAGRSRLPGAACARWICRADRRSTEVGCT